MTIAATIGVPYNPGNCDGVYPTSVAPRAAALKCEYSDVVPDGINVANGGAGDVSGGASPDATRPAGR
jgi:hypothetical protein